MVGHMRLKRSSQPDGPGSPPDVDTALVLSGGSINGIYLQLGFLQVIRESELWPAVGWVYGTSAGAFSGWAAARDAIDEHLRFARPGVRGNEHRDVRVRGLSLRARGFGDQCALLRLVERALAFGIAAAVADDVGAGKGREHLRRVREHVGIDQQRHRQLQLGE